MSAAPLPGAALQRPPTLSVELVCGALAGVTVDLTLFPIDTVKTRLQSQAGFLKAGGFRHIYAGIPSVAVGGAPSAALFFCTYECVKAMSVFKSAALPPEVAMPLAEMTAASCGEVVACLIRVPTEVVKQRTQAAPTYTTRQMALKTFSDGGVRGFYRGYATTVMREIPFSFVQFPLWELGKRRVAAYQGTAAPSPLASAACGSLAGMVAAGVTTPLDVAKTRIMLAERLYGERDRVRDVWRDIVDTEGWRGLFAGWRPRIAWMGVGGFVFFGAYEAAKYLTHEPWSFSSPTHTLGSPNSTAAPSVVRGDDPGHPTKEGGPGTVYERPQMNLVSYVYNELSAGLHFCVPAWLFDRYFQRSGNRRRSFDEVMAESIPEMIAEQDRNLVLLQERQETLRKAEAS